jgi:hypothetical protein
MKKSICLAASLLALNLVPAFGQPNQSNYAPAPAPAPQSGVSFQQRLQAIRGPGAPQSEAPALTRFDLNFPGGTPGQLVVAIEKATGKPLNAIIPHEYADEQLPPLKMNNVDVPRLFKALKLASVRQVQYETSTYFGGIGGPASSYSTYLSSYGFKTEGPETDDSVWYFLEDQPPKPPLPQSTPANSCRFYQLAPYLERGLTVDDITTAIQTGWKMMRNTSPPEISFHKETKLLIAVGEPDELEVIDNVLKALQPTLQNPSGNFQDRLKRIIKDQSQASVPAAPPTTPQRMPPIAKPPESPATGQ